MKNWKYLQLIIVLSIVLSSCSNTIDVNSLKEGDKLGTMLIDSIKIEKGMKLYLHPTTIEGKVHISEDSHKTSVKMSEILGNVTLEWLGSTQDLTTFDKIELNQSEQLKIHINPDFYKRKNNIDVLKSEYQDSISTSISFDNIILVWDSKKFELSGDIKKIHNINGNELTKPVERNLKQYLRRNENSIRFMIKQIQFVNKIGGLEYTNNIKDFKLYKEFPEFKELTDRILGYGYGIEQAEGEYYLFIGKAHNYVDGEVE
jgi:hypothetical protein